jgi:hypothetical protein
MIFHGEGSGDKGRRPLAVTVDNEADGRRLAIRVDRDETVQRAIDDLYEQLGRSPNAEDRLRCAVSEADVRFFASLETRDYLDHYCPDLHWLFAGPVGGASR